MRFAIHTLLAVVLAMALAFALVVAVELFSAAVYPVPAEREGNIPEHVRHYPDWILAVVVLAWGVTIAAATWVASRVGNRLAGSLVALLLAWALIYNLTALPYTLWFKIVMIAVLPIACVLGVVSGTRRRSRIAGARATAG